MFLSWCIVYISMAKQALLIGCDYAGTPVSLQGGCSDDIQNVQTLLTNVYGYNSSNITVLCDNSSDPDKLPTQSNILKSLQTMVQSSASLKEIWFHYSGHGTQERFTNGIEDVIVPVDVISSDGTINKDKLINADTIHSYLEQINSSCRALFLFDSCHSGTICELPYTYTCNTTNGLIKSVTSKPNTLPSSNIYMISGCQDNQTSSNVYLSSMKEYTGAFTSVFIVALQKYNYSIDIKNLYSTVCRDLKNGGFGQLPMLSSSNSSPRNFIFMPDSSVSRPIPAIIPMPTPLPYLPPIKTSPVITYSAPPSRPPRPSGPKFHESVNATFKPRKSKKSSKLTALQKKQVQVQTNHSSIRVNFLSMIVKPRQVRVRGIGKAVGQAALSRALGGVPIREINMNKRKNTKLALVFV
jgi:hypothetical protein